MHVCEWLDLSNVSFPNLTNISAAGAWEISFLMSLSCILVAPAEQWSDQNYPNTFHIQILLSTRGKKCVFHECFGFAVTLRTTGLPSLMSWASIMATLWSMVVEWSVLSAEFPTKVPRAKTAAHLTCSDTNTSSIQLIVSKKARLMHLYSLWVWSLLIALPFQPSLALCLEM